MMNRTALLACAASLALASPTLAQTSASGDGAEVSWPEVSQPAVRIVRTDANGNIVFDSNPDAAPGVNDPDLAEKVAEADGETVAETDAAGAPVTVQAPSTQGSGRIDEIGREATEGTEDPARGSAMAGDLSQVQQGVVTSEGLPVDVQEFARQMFEQGYRQGYVSGLTEMRGQAMRQMRDQEVRFADQRRQIAQGLRAQERQAIEQRRQDGGTVLVLPAGMTAQEFIAQIQAADD